MKSCFAIAVMMAASLGCTPSPKSGDGFTLPDGDADKGKQTFVRLRCNDCHSVAGVDVETPESDQKIIALGGETTYVKTYGDLVTSIINPSHRFAAGYTDEQIKQDGQSKMRIYNDEMTITELTDLVAFLQSRYKLRAYQPTPYMPYY